MTHIAESVEGEVIKGHGVASGTIYDPRYPNGSLYLQIPFFEREGIDFRGYFRGTINVDISPYNYAIVSPLYFVKQVNWSEYIPSENFYFFEAKVVYNSVEYEGVIYLPDPETKPDHFQPNHMLELIMPKMEGLTYGDKVLIKPNPDQLILEAMPRNQVRPFQ